MRLAIMKFGVGSWNKILDSGCLPGKNKSQLCLQTQRLLGQQSLGGSQNRFLALAFSFLLRVFSFFFGPTNDSEIKWIII